MQKKLIAMAVAGLVAAPAFAQSNVTIYGVVDAYVNSTFAGGGQRHTGLDSGGASGSRLGFKGVEDLGNGLKSVFVLEYALTNDVDSGIGTKSTGAGNARQTYVGLSGKFGTVVGGRLQTPGKYAADDYDITGQAWYSPMVAMEKYASPTIHTSSRLDNTVAYISPTYYGLTATVAYSFASTSEEDGKAGNRGNVGALGVKYANGPLSATYVFHTLSNYNGTALGLKVVDIEMNEHFLGASYDFGQFAVMGSAQVADAKGLTNRVYQVGGSMKVGSAGKVVLQYATASMQGDKAGADAYGVGYFHSLSKRTDLYAGVARVNNDKAGVAGLGAISSSLGEPGIAPDANVTTYGFGLRHKF